MQNLQVSSGDPNLLVEPRRSPSQRGLERLGVLPPEAADAALAQLTAAGLSCRVAAGPRLHLQGGASSFVASGLHGYERPFAILEEAQGGFTAMVAGTRSFHDEELRVPTLAQAVEAVLRIYHARGLLPATGDHR